MINKITGSVLLYPKVIILSFLFLSLLSILVIFNSLDIDTSTDALINKNLKFKIDQKNLKKDFEILDNNILIRVSGEKSEVKKISRLIIDELSTRNDLSFFYSPSLDEIFKKNFFVFLNESQKKKLISNLYKYQPFISEIGNNPRLRGLNNLLSLTLKKENLDDDEILNLTNILKSFKEASLKNEKVDWFEIFKKGRK